MTATLYAPGLPPGEHDVWCMPVDGSANEMQRLIDDYDRLTDRLADLLSRTAIALRGPKPPRTRWGWNDLPDRAAAAIAAIDVMQRAAAINGAAAERALETGIDVEHLLAECVPGGSICDPQQVADAIRGYCATKGASTVGRSRAGRSA